MNTQSKNMAHLARIKAKTETQVEYFCYNVFNQEIWIEFKQYEIFELVSIIYPLWQNLLGLK